MSNYPDKMTQSAPFPVILADLVKAWRYKPGWRAWLENESRGEGDEGGLTLTILSANPDSYDVSAMRKVRHLFIVPAATYNQKSWLRWFLDRVLNVEQHEAVEFFRFEFDGATTRPFAPLHGPGNDPYFLYMLSSDVQQRTLQDGNVLGTRIRPNALDRILAADMPKIQNLQDPT